MVTLFGKPLLKQFRAMHDYENDTIHIPNDNRESETIANSTSKTPKYHTERRAQHNQGECKPPSRQVSSPDFTESELVDKHHTANNTATSTDSNANLVDEHQPGKRRGRRSREKAEKNKRHAQQESGFWEAVWTMLWFNLIRVEICELRPEVVTEDYGVLVHYQSRTNE